MMKVSQGADFISNHASTAKHGDERNVQTYLAQAKNETHRATHLSTHGITRKQNSYHTAQPTYNTPMHTYLTHASNAHSISFSQNTYNHAALHICGCMGCMHAHAVALGMSFVGHVKVGYKLK